MLATVTCWLDSGNSLSEALRAQLLTLRPESNASGPKSLFPLWLPRFSSVLASFPPCLCPETVSPTTKVAGVNPRSYRLVLQPVHPTLRQSELYDPVLPTPREFRLFFSFGVSCTPPKFRRLLCPLRPPLLGAL